MARTVPKVGEIESVVARLSQAADSLRRVCDLNVKGERAPVHFSEISKSSEMILKHAMKMLADTERYHREIRVRGKSSIDDTLRYYNNRREREASGQPKRGKGRPKKSPKG